MLLLEDKKAGNFELSIGATSKVVNRPASLVDFSSSEIDAGPP